MNHAPRLIRLLQAGAVAVALVVGATLTSCADDRAASPPVSAGASSTPRVTDERAALPPAWVSGYVKAAMERFGEPKLVEWTRVAGRPADGGLVGDTTDVATEWYFFGDFAQSEVSRRLGGYVVAAQGHFLVSPADGTGSPISARTVVIVFHGVQLTDRDSIRSAHLTAYLGTVHLAKNVHVYGPPTGLAPVPETLRDQE
jgi:hypothetical protein